LIGQAPLAGPSGPASGVEAASALKDSIVVEALNPKSALFFLGIIVNAMFTISDLVLIEMSDLAARRARTSKGIARVLPRIGGGMLILARAGRCRHVPHARDPSGICRKAGTRRWY
jgi:threonine/homoserine/homoserine lactone efflux protein